MKRWLGAAAIALVAIAPASAGRDAVGRVVFARGDSLWLTDAMGKAAPVAIATLPGPASEVRTVRTDATGTTLLVDVAGRWYWTPVPAAGATTAAPLSALPCGPGAARLSRDGRCALCADEHGQAWFLRLGDTRGAPRELPASSTTFVERDGARQLVWAAPGEPVLLSPVGKRAPQMVAPSAPVRGFLAAPDGSRAVGVYRAPAVGKPAMTGERDQLFGFALDGIGARRRLIRDGVVIDWSWNSQWLLIQDHAAACIARAIGGEYKCWKGFTAVSIAPDGSYALVLGPRGGPVAAPAPAEGGGDGEGGEGGEGESDEDGEDEIEEETVALPKGPLSLYRAKLAGPYSEAPALVQQQVDGAAAWLP